MEDRKQYRGFSVHMIVDFCAFAGQKKLEN
jgi:hypothetical protein